MAAATITDLRVLSSKDTFTAPYAFQIQWECHEELAEDLEFTMTYIGSPSSEAHDQILDSVDIGPCPQGCNRIVFRSDAGPDVTRIPPEDLLGVTVILIT